MDAFDARNRILEAAEDLLRRHGPAKTNVVDVARALGMSHANVYRHFASKTALREAVAERWLDALKPPLLAVSSGSGSAARRLEEWILTLAALKRRKVLDDPELFATYHALAEESRAVVETHVAWLQAQVGGMIREGAAAGEFKVDDAAAAARAVLNATLRFHLPQHVRESAHVDVEQELKAVIALAVAGLKAGVV